MHPINSDPRRFGVVKFGRFREENGIMFGEIENMVEKPDASVAESFRQDGYSYVLAGYYVFKPSIFSYIEKTKPSVGNEIQITDAMELAIENGERVNAVLHAKSKDGTLFPCEYWDVGIPEDYKEANRRLLDKTIDKWLRSEG